MYSISSKLINNHNLYKRDFLWRNTKDPFLIMIAEFMLHRTKAEQVAPVYKEFIQKYPDLFSLSIADENDVKVIIESLGLHWRLEHFKTAPLFILENYDGIYPQTREKLLAIPGIGDYVAGAILTVCFNKPEFVIDSNIARFINRFYGLNQSGEIRRKKVIVEKAKELFNISQPRNFLFALLDFTALICKPRKPECEKCILNDTCNYAKINF